VRPAWTWVTHNWTLKLASLGVAILLWTVVRAEDVVSTTIPGVRVYASIRDPGWELAVPPAPASVRVQLTGPVRELVRLAFQRPEVLVPVEEVRDSVLVLVVRDSWIRFPLGVTRTRVEDVAPATIRLVFDPMATRTLGVALRVRGQLPAGLVLTGPIALEPGQVRASGPRRRLQGVDSVRLPPLDLSHLTDTTALTMDIDTARMGLVVVPASVRVRVPVGRAGGAPADGPPGADSSTRAAPGRDSARAPRPAAQR
jgi:YbbR domain-containing protein